MRAVVLTEYGQPEKLRVAELPEPAVLPGEILIRTAAAAVNPVDLQTRSGLHEIAVPMPMILGWDISGTVVESNGTAFAPGDRVVAMSAQMATGRGTTAELVALDAAIAAYAPRSIPLPDAAALPLAGLTAYQALDKLDLPGGSVVLVTGARGAVGGFVVELARLRGLTVIEHGRSTDEDTVSELPYRKADGLVDTAGIPAAIRSVRDGGVAVSIVPTRAVRPERDIDVRMSFVEQSGVQLAELVKLVDEGLLRVRVGAVLDFCEAATPHSRLAAGGSRGKILLTP